MKKVVNLLAVLVFTCAFASLAQAQATRTWVSGVGDDANPCSRTAPCKTFAGAISKTAACGEIDVIDPGGFGTVTITKAITIDGAGTMASILATGTTGVIINVGSTSDVVTLRNLSINGACTGVFGVRVIGNMPKAVNIEDCVIFRFSNNGIEYNTTAGTLGELNVRNSVVRETLDAVSAQTSVGIVKGTLVNSSFTGGTNGLRAKRNSRVHADRCNFSGNTSDGVFADGTGGTGVADITNSLISNNTGAGIEANAGGVGRINNCDIFANAGTGALVGAGEIDTWGNNRIFSNGTDGCPSCQPKGVS
jgi:hypothetical protein